MSSATTESKVEDKLPETKKEETTTTTTTATAEAPSANIFSGLATTSKPPTGTESNGTTSLLFGAPKAESDKKDGKNEGNDEAGEGANDDEEEVATDDPYYEPIIKLDAVVVKTNEEDEEVLFKM